jgi:hypothetical protein
VSRMRAILIALLLCLSCADAPEVSAAVPQRRAGNRITVRAKRHTSVVVTERGRAHALNIEKHIGAAHIEDASVLFLSRAGGSIYLVLNVCGLSKLPPDDRQCGAGIECNIIWLKLDNRWKEVKAQSELYESCWLPITSDDGPKVKDRRLTLEIDNLREWVHKQVGYDADNPGEGLTFKSFTIAKDER